MTLVADRINDLFSTYWERIVEFLKLHYVLSARPEPYWQAHRDPASIPTRLAGLLDLWKYQPPSSYDLPLANEIFPAASYQYVYYGMGGAIPPDLPELAPELMMQIDQVAQRTRTLLSSLPTNRAYFDVLRAEAQRREVEA